MEVCVEAVTSPVRLGEGPHWDEEEQALYFVSIFDRTIHKYLPADNTHTTATLDGMPTFIIPVEGKKHHFVVGLDRRVVEVHWSGEHDAATVLRTIATVDEHSPDNRLNDAKADPRGRLFAGNPRLIFKYSDHGLKGIVDGMTIDTDGNLWVANFDNYQVIKIDPRAGEILQTVRMPALQVTSATWGGRGRGQLYVTSAALQRAPAPAPPAPPAGATFRVSGLGARGHGNANVRLD
ncbi:unnamed protein product [Diatraea saccharalis]|uniref:Regucalcin n=1 Tax=Diatraea saccharalis TaxID=40085 RepID=A0A9N9R239_9NEOP|nr:unnamed protein product [Diatraea saccharalis]